MPTESSGKRRPYYVMLRTAIVLACALIPIASGAQSDTSARAPLPRCWRGKPLPQCRSFFITEMAGEYTFVTAKTNYTLPFGNHVEARSTADESAQLLWRIGPMFNTAPSRAMGVTLSAGAVNEGGREAEEVGRRGWISTEQAVDFSAGALRMDITNSPPRPTGAAYGLTTGIYLLGGDLIHVDGHADFVI